MDKQHILREIQRTARANAGVALGRAKFRQETGIKESDWSGIHWARWGEALREAGFIANELQSAHDDDYLLERYVALIRELNRVPVATELRLKKRIDPSFPSHNTFARFGTKQQLIAKTIEFCRSGGCLDDVEQICLVQVPVPTPMTDSDEILPSVNDELGFVYLLHFGGDEYKIGCSNNVERRFREIKTQMPYDGKIIHAIETGDPQGIEAYWHQFFKEKRLKGEWFKLSANDVRYFKKRKLM